MITECALFVGIITLGCTLLMTINGGYGRVAVYGDSAKIALTKPFTGKRKQTLLKQKSASFTQF
jgi:hypothetical protein